MTFLRNLWRMTPQRTHAPSAWVVLLAFLLLWQVRTVGSITTSSLLALVLLVLLYWAFGRLLQLALRAASTGVGHAGAGLLGGFFIVNTSLFVMALVLPFGITINAAILGGIALAGTLVTWRRWPAMVPDEVSLPCLLAFMVSGIGATLWCSDAQTPYVVVGENAVFQAWRDSFIHIGEIKIFAQARGMHSIDDIKLAGAAAPVYHFASYLSASAVTGIGGVAALETFSSMMLPLGLFLCGVAAFALITSLFGGWAGLAAAIAIMLLPDAFHQGFGNRALSYNFLSQVNPGLLYGIACVAFGWMFLLEACRRGKFALLLLAYGLLGVCLFYKAHLFVANAYLMMIFPCLYFLRISARWRLLMGAAGSALFIVVVSLSQTMARVPVLRLDGSGVIEYRATLIGMFENAMLGEFFAKVAYATGYPMPVQLVYFAAMLLMCSFGIWLAGTALLLYLDARRSVARIDHAARAFVLLVLLNYLVMAMGLAMDARHVGTRDELLNRPMVWAYFVVTAWTAGAAFDLLARRARAGAAKAVLGVAALVGVALTLVHAPNLQTMPMRADYRDFSASRSLPLCMVKAAQFMRTHGQPGQRFIDSFGDNDFAATALSERQAWVGRSDFGGMLPGQRARLEQAAALARMVDSADVYAFAAANDITWYLLRPPQQLAWESALADQSAYACGGYRLYRLTWPGRP